MDIINDPQKILKDKDFSRICEGSLENLKSSSLQQESRKDLERLKNQTKDLRKTLQDPLFMAKSSVHAERALASLQKVKLHSKKCFSLK